MANQYVENVVAMYRRWGWAPKFEHPGIYCIRLGGRIVYIGKSTNKAISSKALWQRFSKLLRGAGIEICGTHSLRHTCATQIYQHSFGNVKLVAQQLRHTDSTFTTKTYVHQDDARTREIIGEMKI